jgi:hypothetical protein
VGVLRENGPAFARLLVAARLENEEPKSGGRPPVTVSRETLLEILRRGLERARSTTRVRQPSYEAIADEFGMKRTWTTPIVKWAEKHQREAREAIALSKTPERFSTIVADRQP